jgi:DNA-binding MarR family transcriptional regulator
MTPCPVCGGYLRAYRRKVAFRIRRCLQCKKRFKTEEVVLHEVGTMTEERLIRFLSERKGWQSYETIARHFCVTPATAQNAIKKLERENRVHYKFGENGRKLWHLVDKEVAPPAPRKSRAKPQPDPVAVPASRVYRIQDGEDRAAAKPRTKTPTQPQSWFSVLGK